MKPLHFLAAIAVVAIWGFNFVVIKIGLKELPPILLSALRFTLVALPAIFIIRRPVVPLLKIAQYGLAMFALQFSLMFGGLYLGMSAGLASLAMQIQVFVTIALAIFFLKEKASLFQALGAVVAFAGIVLVALNVGGDVSVSGLLCILLAAAAWGVGNLFSKKIGKVDMVALVVWGSAVAAPPLFALSFAIEGSDRIVASLTHLTWTGIMALAYITYPTTLLCFAIWGWLLNRYAAATVAPLTLMVPLFGMASSALVLGEKIQDWKIMAAVLVISGLCINLFGPALKTRLTRWVAVKP